MSKIPLCLPLARKSFNKRMISWRQNIGFEKLHLTSKGKRVYLESPLEFHLVEILNQKPGCNLQEIERALKPRFDCTLEDCKRSMIDLELKEVVVRLLEDKNQKKFQASFPDDSNHQSSNTKPIGIKGPGGIDLAHVHRLINSKPQQQPSSSEEENYIYKKIKWNLA